jgi:hypothetical protein
MTHEEAVTRLRDRGDSILEKFDFRQNLLDNAEPEKVNNMRSRFSYSCLEVGVYEYFVHHDIAMFRKFLREAARQRYLQFAGYDAGEIVDESYVIMLQGYEAIYRALASGDFDLAKEISLVVGGREDVEVRQDHPYNIALGYLLKSFVEGDGENIKRSLIENFRAGGEQNTAGVISVFEAILSEDEERLSYAFDRLLVDHRNGSKPGGIYELELGYVISIYGVGLANFARNLGMQFDLDDSYIPRELVI